MAKSALLVSLVVSFAAIAGDAHAQDDPAPSAAPGATLDAPAPDADIAGARLAVTASFFSRYEVRSHYDELGLVGRRLGENDGVAYRARLGLALLPVELGGGRTIALRFVPQASGFWGDVSGGLTDADLDLHEAVARIAGGPMWIEAGRFEMAYGEHLVIGDVGWHETGRSFDGARLRGDLGRDGAYVDAFATFVAEGGAIGATDPIGASDQYFLGIYAGLGPLIDEALELDGYVLVTIAPETDDGPASQDFTAAEATIGSRVLVPVGAVALRAEAGLQAGRRPGVDADVLAYQVDAGALADLGDRAKLGVRGAFASGDDPDTADNEGWNQLYPTAHKFFGLMDIMGGRSNIASITLEGRADLADSVLLALDGHTFFRPETPMGVDPYTGFEADLWTLWKIGRGLGLRAQASVFVPNDSGPFGTNDVARYYELQLRYDR